MEPNQERPYPHLIWKAHEYHHRPKSNEWFLGLAIILVTVFIISALLGNALFGLMISVAFFTLSYLSHQKPKEITVETNPKGVRVNSVLYHYKDLEAFWVELEENPYHPHLLFKSKKFLMPYIVVPLGNIHPDDAGDFLAQFLPEKEMKESLLVRIFQDFGF
jgi:hypothetical protein